MKKVLCLLGLVAWMWGAQNAHAKKYTFRIATLAPGDSSWGRVFIKMRRDLLRESKGQIRIKFYPDGRMGDEKLVVNKMKLGQLHGASITSIGLAQIVPSVLLLQQPALFRSYKELDYVREKMDAELRAQFVEKGFVLLGWGDMGYVYLYSKQPIDSVEKLKSTKIWGWTDDPITKQFSESSGITPHMLGILDVRSSLQTGAIDTVIGTPLSIIAMQWHSYVKYRVKYRFAIGVGATVITKKSFDRLPKELQDIVLRVSQKHHTNLIQVIRRDNNRALKVLTKRGLEHITVPAAEKKLIRQLSRKTWDYFTDKLFSKADLEKVKGLLKEFRKK